MTSTLQEEFSVGNSCLSKSGQGKSCVGVA